MLYTGPAARLGHGRINVLATNACVLLRRSCDYPPCHVYTSHGPNLLGLHRYFAPKFRYSAWHFLSPSVFCFGLARDEMSFKENSTILVADDDDIFD